ncbi:MAG: virulence protein [Anaerotignaceae bacterium]
MKISYNVTGDDRKKLVAVISKELNQPTKYLGVPSFAYEVGGYVIDRSGTLTGEDNPSLISEIQELYNFNPTKEEYDAPIAILTFVPDYKEIQIPKKEFDHIALENLQNLIDSKKALIKKALGIDSTHIEIGEHNISFPWVNDESDSLKRSAYTAFIKALCQMAKSQSRINKSEKVAQNEKYAFRCFLLRLGFIGNAYKSQRKILLQNLTGNSAFKGGVDNE